MLKFLVYKDGQPATEWPLRNCYLIGPDNVGVRGTITFSNGVITCEKRATGSASFALQYPIDDIGEMTIQTCLLPERDEPYLLSLELARHRIMSLISKQEEWMMFDLDADHVVTKRLEVAKKRFVEALNEMDLARSHELACKALTFAADASEELALAHAERLINRRISTGLMPRNVFGCQVSLEKHHVESQRTLIESNFDYVSLPTRWRELEPQEQEFSWQPLDSWMEWAVRNHLPILAGPMVSFAPNVVPDWMYIWEHDYEMVRELLHDYVQQVVRRYRSAVTVWNVASGIHVNRHFKFTFEQIMDLTRMTLMQTRKIQPNARTIVELTHPFGEYSADNPQSLPPLMFAEVVLQSGLPVDGFGLKLLMGQAGDGQYARDLLQISGLLDQFKTLGKPVHITAVGVPSESVRQSSDSNSDVALKSQANSGYWRQLWSPKVQAHWMEAFYNLALSRPYVESISWACLVDHEDADLPYSGLTNVEFSPKHSLKRLVGMRKNLQNRLKKADEINSAAEAGSAG